MIVDATPMTFWDSSMTFRRFWRAACCFSGAFPWLSSKSYSFRPKAPSDPWPEFAAKMLHVMWIGGYLWDLYIYI